MCALDIRRGGSPPPDFNFASLTLLAKKPSHEVDGVKWYLPKDTRPISVINTDNRIIANLYRQVLSRFADKMCRSEQQGFLSNRWLLQNVVDVDMEARKLYVKDGKGGMFLVDLSAAFPSLGHEYLFKVLARQGVPDDFLNALRMFYVENQHFTSLDGESSKSFKVHSGVRQGCPMSPVLFALALDPFLDHLCRKLPPTDMVRAYADDTCIVVQDVHTLPVISKCFTLLAKASCLTVNIDKTVFVPLYPATHAQARTDIRMHAWANMEIHIGHGKYLGFQVGPKASAEKNFAAPMEKFRKRALHWLGLRQLGAYFQTFGFNMCALSVLGFTSRLYMLPDSFAKEANSMALRFMHGPRFWIHGPEGHAFFRAQKDLGLKAVPRCPKSACHSLCFQGTRKFVEDHTKLIQSVEELVLESPIPCTEILDVIRSSPAWSSKVLYEQSFLLDYVGLCARAPIHMKVQSIAYDCFFIITTQRDQYISCWRKSFQSIGAKKACLTK
jgi:hypothetical protein